MLKITKTKPKKKSKPIPRVTVPAIKKMIKDGTIPLIRTCDQCNKELPLKDFSIDKRNNSYFKPTCIKCVEKLRKNPPPSKKLIELDQSLALNERFSKALIMNFGENLETLVDHLRDLLGKATTTPTLKVSIINTILDRVLGKATQTQIIEQKVIQVNITKPDLSSIDVTPKDV